MACDQRDVFRPLLKLRRINAHYIDAVKKILTKFAFRDQLAQVLVRSEDEAGAQWDELIRAGAAEFHLLQNAEELYLREHAQIADFIEEEGAVAGLLEVAFARANSAGECAFFMA